MQALSAVELLHVWEQSPAQLPAQRVLALLAFACAETPVERLGQLTAGQRDAQLLMLREQIFGPQLASIVACPACDERLEFTVNAADLRPIRPPEPPAVLTLTHAKYYVEFRLPNSLDLANLDAAADEETNRQHLFRRCVRLAQRDGANITPAELPLELEAAVVERMAEADPQANIQLAIRCPECRHEWQAPLDIVSYLWSEIHAWASRLLREIHVLASAYGWREADILALNPRRRQAYLEMIDR
jgi:hypothetical protein